MRHHANLVAAGLLLAAPLLSQAAEVTLTVSGQITSTQTYFAFLDTVDLNGFGVTPQDRANATAALSNLTAGQAVSLSYTFDTDAMPWHSETTYEVQPSGNPPGEGPRYVVIEHPDDIVGGRFGADQYQASPLTTHLTVADAGLDYSNTASSNTGSRFVRIRQLDSSPAQGSYLDFHVADDRRFSTGLPEQRFYDSFISFTRMTGADWQERDLLKLINTFDYAGSQSKDGRFYVFDPICSQNYGQCGYAEFSVQNVTVAAVPEPATWASMSLGLLGMAGAGLARRRRERQLG